MYNKVAKYIAKEMIKNSIIAEKKSDIYVYGFELMIAYFFYFASLLVIAFASKTIVESILFCFGFMVVRKYSGGYHAQNYLRCQLLFIINQLMFIGIIKITPSSIYKYMIVFTVCTYIVFVWLFAPVDNSNKKFNKNEYVYFKKASRICSIIIVVLISFIYYYFNIPDLIISFLVGVCSASISLAVGFLQQKTNNREVIT